MVHTLCGGIRVICFEFQFQLVLFSHNLP
jgi:hypothetical protein